LSRINSSLNELSKLLLTQQAIPFVQLLTYNSTVLADNPALKPGDFYLSKGEIKTHYRSLESEMRRKEAAEETVDDFVKGYFAAFQWYSFNRAKGQTRKYYEEE